MPKKKKSKKKISKLPVEKEIIYKTKKDWIKQSTLNKSQYEKNIKRHFLKMITFGKKKERELIGLNLIQKLKMWNIAIQMLE